MGVGLMGVGGDAQVVAVARSQASAVEDGDDVEEEIGGVESAESTEVLAADTEPASGDETVVADEEASE